ncbi:MAG: TIGR00159 family protein, partial [Chloroflexi bacterium]|nr:TIGR00159 family protein [Chloroflexota bacterium]
TGVVGSALNLTILNWLVQNSLPAVLIAIPVVFQPELRRVLEQLGRTGNLLTTTRTRAIAHTGALVADEVSRGCQVLIDRGFGALLVFERTTGLEEYVQSATRLDALVSAELLHQVFFRGSPLHDGAVLIRQDRMVAARCLLPLSDNPILGPELGTRHRAAVGITEGTDAICVVVSEETGAVSIAEHGQLHRLPDHSHLERELTAFLAPAGVDRGDGEARSNSFAGLWRQRVTRTGPRVSAAVAPSAGRASQ